MKKVTCEIIGKEGLCYQNIGDTFIVGLRTEANICTKMLHAIYPMAYALMFDRGDSPRAMEVTCPDGIIKVRLSID